MAETTLPRRAWLLVLAGGVALFVAVQRALVTTGDPNFIPSVIFLGAAVVPATFVAFVFGRRLPYDVPVGVVGLAALVGGVVGTVVAGVLEYNTLRRLGFLPLVAVGAIEEASKLIVPAAILLFTRYRRPADGLLVGVASGAGFAALETMGYAFVDVVHSHGNITAVENLLLVRGILSPAGHMAWTGILAAALWECAAQRWTRRSIRHLVAAYLIVVLLHSLWDGVSVLPAFGVIAGVSLVLLGWVTHRAAVLGGVADGRLFHGIHRRAEVTAGPVGGPQK